MQFLIIFLHSFRYRLITEKIYCLIKGETKFPYSSRSVIYVPLVYYIYGDWTINLPEGYAKPPW